MQRSLRLKLVAKNSTAGLLKAYKNLDNNISKYVKFFFGSTFLKPEMFDYLIDNLMIIKLLNSNVYKFCNYLLETYTRIKQDTLFPPNIWAVIAATTNRTITSCESFHAKLIVSSFDTTHPNIYVLLGNLLGIQSKIYISLQSFTTLSSKKQQKKIFFSIKNGLWRTDQVVWFKFHSYT